MNEHALTIEKGAFFESQKPLHYFCPGISIYPCENKEREEIEVRLYDCSLEGDKNRVRVTEPRERKDLSQPIKRQGKKNPIAALAERKKREFVIRAGHEIRGGSQRERASVHISGPLP